MQATKRDQVLELNRQGKTMQEIASMLGLSIQATARYLDRSGSEKTGGIPSGGKVRENYHYYLRAEDAPEIVYGSGSRKVVSSFAIAARIKNGWTIHEVAFSLGITPEEAKQRYELTKNRNPLLNQFIGKIKDATYAY